MTTDIRCLGVVGLGTGIAEGSSRSGFDVVGIGSHLEPGAALDQPRRG